MQLIVSLIIAWFVYKQIVNYLQRYQKIIDFNKSFAYDSEKRLLESLDKEIEEALVRISEEEEHQKTKKTKIPKGLFNIAEIQMSAKRVIHFKERVIPNFKNHFTRLEVRYRGDDKKLAEVSADYRDWFLSWEDIYEPHPEALESDYYLNRSQKSHAIITEINSKFDFDMEFEKLKNPREQK